MGGGGGGPSGSGSDGFVSNMYVEFDDVGGVVPGITHGGGSGGGDTSWRRQCHKIFVLLFTAFEPRFC